MVMGLLLLFLGYGFTAVLESIDELLKITFLKHYKYIFYSGCSKRSLRFVKYFRDFLSNFTEDPENQGMT